MDRSPNLMEKMGGDGLYTAVDEEERAPSEMGKKILPPLSLLLSAGDGGDRADQSTESLPEGLSPAAMAASLEEDDGASNLVLDSALNMVYLIELSAPKEGETLQDHHDCSIFLNEWMFKVGVQIPFEFSILELLYVFSAAPIQEIQSRLPSLGLAAVEEGDVGLYPWMFHHASSVHHSSSEPLEKNIWERCASKLGWTANLHL
ncbi:hypothetical protein ACLOJK_026493 [Asimina triloba]